MVNQKIVYTKNSPDSRKSSTLKTYPNQYKRGRPRPNQVPLETLTEVMVITNLTINNESVPIENKPNIVCCRLHGSTPSLLDPYVSFCPYHSSIWLWTWWFHHLSPHLFHDGGQSSGKLLTLQGSNLRMMGVSGTGISTRLVFEANKSYLWWSNPCSLLMAPWPRMTSQTHQWSPSRASPIR